MNITVGDYQIRREPTGQTFIYRKGTTQGSYIANPPSASEIAGMSFETAHTKMQIAYETGEWPTNRCPRCGK